PLNPNGKLTEIAKERGWPLQKFDSRGQGKPVDYLRTIYATGSLVTSFVAGLPIWALTGSQREATNFSTGLDRKSTRLNSSHVKISYAVFCMKKKKSNQIEAT